MRIAHISTWLLTLATTLAPAGCALPDDDASMAFRTTVVGGGGDVNNDDASNDPPVEMPECIVVTTPPADPTEGEYEQPPEDAGDIGLPGSESTTGGTSYGAGDDFGLPTTGEEPTGGTSYGAGDDRGLPPGGGSTTSGTSYGAGDDFGGVPMDPTGATLCPGVDELVTVHAVTIEEAAAKCDRYYGHCCDEACAAWDTVPDTSCALEADDPLAEGYTDINPNSGGEYVCGCDCMPGLVIN